MPEAVRVDAYVCNQCGFRFLGGTSRAADRRLQATKRTRLVLCPKCSGPCRRDRFAAARGWAGFVIFTLVVGGLIVLLAMWLGWL